MHLYASASYGANALGQRAYRHCQGASGKHAPGNGSGCQRFADAAGTRGGVHSWEAAASHRGVFYRLGRPFLSCEVTRWRLRTAVQLEELPSSVADNSGRAVATSNAPRVRTFTRCYVDAVVGPEPPPRASHQTEPVLSWRVVAGGGPVNSAVRLLLDHSTMRL